MGLRCGVLQAFLQDLGGQTAMVSFSELSCTLLRDYSADDTRKVKEMLDAHSKAWNAVLGRYEDPGDWLHSSLSDMGLCSRIGASVFCRQGALLWNLGLNFSP